MSDGEQQVEVTSTKDQVQIAQQPSADIVFATPSDIEAFDSEKARAIAEFDDSRIKILSNREVSVTVRGERGKANPSIRLENFFIVPGLNARLQTQEWEDHIEWLTGQILKEGFREDCPLLVFPTLDESGQHKYGIISGESRFHAATRAAKRGAPIVSLPVVLTSEGSSMEEMSIQVATSNTGKPFTPLELALLAQRFAKWRKEPAEIARFMKVSTNYVHQLLRIASAPHQVRAMIQDGTVSFGTALAAINADSTTAVESLQKGVAMAKAAGKGRLTNKFLPEKQAEKAARTFSPEMHAFLKRLQSNELTMGLMEDEDRTALNDLVKKIEEMANATPESIAQAKAEKDAAAKEKKEEQARKKKLAADNKAKALARKQEAAAKRENKRAEKNQKDQDQNQSAIGRGTSAKATTGKKAADGANKPSKGKANATSQAQASAGTSKATVRIRDGADLGGSEDDDAQRHPDD
ncbi:hypothetical protein P245_20250 [Comamonas thiooxydans]|uniref:ParB/Sulfiredoxin domain-containing protein n=1 Tax=Comamonas thiooxydans TaxID=363952 RepID=A0A0E3BY60_9BURK|nr:hypothetical protein [Comamonas thiooxydans]KGG87397.1 hypothetical protein P245_20250 [Comamonas thiooxydans]